MPSPRVALTSFLVSFACMFVATWAYGMRTSHVAAALLYAVLVTGLHLVSRMVVGRRADLPAAAFVVTVAGYLLVVRLLPHHDPLQQDGAALGLGVLAAAGVAGWRAQQTVRHALDDQSAPSNP